MIVAGLGQCAGCGAGHDLLVDLEVRVRLFKRLDAHIQILLEGRHDAFILGALHVRHGGDDVQLGTPRIGERGRDLQRLQTPLGFVGADCHLGDGVVQVHQVAFVVGVRHHEIGQYAYAGRLELVVPSSRSARPPLPRLPMTMRL